MSDYVALASIKSILKLGKDGLRTAIEILELPIFVNVIGMMRKV